MHLIVEERGVFVSKHQGRLRVEQGKQRLAEVPIMHLEQVLICSNGVGLSSDEAGREERRSLRNYGLEVGERAFDESLRSQALGLRGRLDLGIAVPSRAGPGAEAIVVEYKDSEKPAGPHFKLQLAAYALLLEEAWGLPVRRGFIYSIPQRQAEIIVITPALRQKVRQTVAAMRAAVAGEHMPEAPASRRPCVSCEFRRFCNDVV